jgi:hypothetical protein
LSIAQSKGLCQHCSDLKNKSSFLPRLRAKLTLFFLIRDFLRETVNSDHAKAVVRERFRNRDETFLSYVDEVVYRNPASPYLKLLDHAGIDSARMRSLVKERGLDASLAELYDLGVYITLDEFKGRTPVRRDGLEFAVRPEDFDDPGARGAAATHTSGSSGVPARAMWGAEAASHNTLYRAVFLDATGRGDFVQACWRAEADVGYPIVFAKIGKRLTKNYGMLAKGRVHGPLAVLESWYILLGCLLSGARFALPEVVPPTEAVKIARWLAAEKQRGHRVLFHAYASPAVRICLAAMEHGLDISGTVFRVGGEPFTPAKAAALRKAGAEAEVAYAMTEMGMVGFSCNAPNAIDEVHLLTDHVGVLQRERTLAGGAVVDGLFYTSIGRSTAKVMLNTESGDYGRLEERRCGCLMEELGFTLHLSEIRSYEKVTSESVTFLGSELYRLVEEVLPSRFGGSMTDYQLVEEETEEGLPKVNILVSPSLGRIDDEAVKETVLRTLSDSDLGPADWTQLWRQAGTLRVVRREPYESRAKVLPLHVLRSGAREPSPAKLETRLLAGRVP